MRLIGVEAAGAASLGGGRTGVLHGSRSSILADEDGQIADAHSISAGLDYPGVGPEHAFLRDTGRAEYLPCTDEEALDAFQRLSRLEGIIPALESSHALAVVDGIDAEYIVRLPLGPRGQGSRRGAERAGEGVVNATEAHRRLSRREAARPLVIYLMAGAETPALAEAAVAGGADIVEIGFPFSDPLADGPVIRAAGEKALAAGMRTAACLECLAATRALVGDTPLIPMTYASLLEAYGWERFETDARAAGATSFIIADTAAGSRPELKRDPARRPHLDRRADRARRVARPTAGSTSSR